MATITRSIPNAHDIRLLYETVRIAAEAKRKGNHPFGALLADKDGNICSNRRTAIRKEALNARRNPASFPSRQAVRSGLSLHPARSIPMPSPV